MTESLEGRRGGAWIALLAALCVGCGEGAPGSDALAGPELAADVAEGVRPDLGFDGERAFAHLRDLVLLGPRPAGSPAAAEARRLIAERLRQFGWRVEEHAFDATAPSGTRHALVNLIGQRRGAVPERILLVTHYDTKRLPGVRFVGANDGASGVAVLLELARVLGPARAESGLQHSVSLVFCDGEEAFGEQIDARDGLYGSRALAERMLRDGSLASVRALILVDMVGDADLNLANNLAVPLHLRRIVEEEARALGASDVLDRGALPGLVDDHTPFVERGVTEFVTLIDFQFGARWTPGPYWHTARDDLTSVSAASLNTVGRLTVQVLRRIDALSRAEPGGRETRNLRYSHPLRGSQGAAALR